jgi:hypothetical protein
LKKKACLFAKAFTFLSAKGQNKLLFFQSFYYKNRLQMFKINKTRKDSTQKFNKIYKLKKMKNI